MATCGSDSGIINVRRLPVTEVIGAGDYIIVDSTAGQTSIIDFSNFIIGLENTTFQVPFETLQSEMTLFSIASSDWDSTWTTVATNSAIWNKFDADVFNITCWDNTCSTVTANSANWNTAYNWGNHAAAGYMLASQAGGLLSTETDPTVASHIKTITSGEKSSWNTVYGFVGAIGSANANKMLIVDSNRDIGNIRNLTVTGEIRAAGDIIAFNQGLAGGTGGANTAVKPITYKFVSGFAFCNQPTWTNIVGSVDRTKNHADIFPPAGYTMDDFVAFISSIEGISFAGGVDANDVIVCEWWGHRGIDGNTFHHSKSSSFDAINGYWKTTHPSTYPNRDPEVDRIRVVCANSEQRSFATVRYLAVWGK